VICYRFRFSAHYVPLSNAWFHSNQHPNSPHLCNRCTRYNSSCFTAFYPEHPRSAGTRRNILHTTLWISWYQWKITEACTDSLDGRHTVRSIGTPIFIIPTIFTPNVLLPQLSEFIPAWDGHQLCCAAYPVAWCVWYGLKTEYVGSAIHLLNITIPNGMSGSFKHDDSRVLL